MDLPKEIRYRPYHEWSEQEFQLIKAKVSDSPWHVHYHIEPRTGLLNDPNGFSYFNGRYHLFYQNWPYGPAHGLKQWVHLISDDLVHFEETGIKLLPDHANDKEGAYSGSAYALGNQLFLFYTGNVRDANWLRDPRQIGAYLSTEGQIKKCSQVLISQPKDVTEHFRDPQIFEYQDQLYAIIGAQSHKKRAFIKLYKAINNDVENWEFLSNLDIGRQASEYMIECPNLVFIDQRPVLIYCPQGLSKKELNYANIYPNTYQIFDAFDPASGRLLGQGPLRNLDFGFEIYATQAFNSPDGRVLAISWIGLPDIDYPTDHYAYQGALSLVKELTIKDDILYQRPVRALSDLKMKPQMLEQRKDTSNCYLLEITVPSHEQKSLVLFADTKGQGLAITVNTQEGKITLDRSQSPNSFAEEFGNKRSCQIPKGDVTLNIYVDRSIVEIFVNDGQFVLTSRYFPEEEASALLMPDGALEGFYYEMRY
ncbi:sucrose-6-phosphate hydrolase [Streptococcus pseudoporcinus]|uniref:Sucrose-6-phosphate hydrolase n=1 Tax=Streptococcus pseudoporcinus TaxID=361101 RepID=A0A4V6L3Z1_9STRE|nr:sucrose-6-phosphate hydrolase [Streptococcus pseudoporcinus]VTS22467.1 sucrose-6-phosphate hydrolase [Streptococcus pseudoporcinus]VUC70321.1 sucrose-6-phosphate hydrolase [Streptococcus pseudoporcinus]VUD00282.1 sucrose-6-phosphate hydrolase [Streptococcus pseudoporcinus]VUD00669.1 sucrose-6-phosphate hydrolase [Streptococcus pseudoporcinus]